MIKKFQDKYPMIDPKAYIMETAVIIGDVTINAGSSIWYNSVVRGDVQSIRIGNRTNVQDNATLHVESGKYSLTIGDDVLVGHNAVIHGCVVGDGCLIGIGAIILNGCVIGEQSVIAAGALVPEGTNVPPKSLLMGVPAKICGKVTDEMIQRIKKGTQKYQELARLHLPER